LQLRAIEATEKLSQSPNSKIIVLGNGQGTPLILPVERDASKSVPTN
ncbi:MAG: prohibitin family protein, partial [Pseudanabaena sp.]